MQELNKICLVGGEDVHKRIDLALCLIDAGFEVTIIGTSKRKFPSSIKYINYNLNRKLSFLSDYKTIKWLKDFFKDSHFDVVHTYDTKPAFLIPIALKKSNIKITRTITGLGTIFMGKGLKNYCLRKIYFLLHLYAKKRVSLTVFQNNADRKLYLKYNLVDEKNTQLILSSGINLKAITNRAKPFANPYSFICVARLVYEKGIINYLEAAKICIDKGFNYKFILIGPIEENSKKLNQQIINNYSQYVDWLGEREDVFNIMEKSNAFVLPTFREGFPRVLLEAGVLGMPIITTNVPGVKEFFQHEKDALLVEVNNSIELANAMEELANNEVICNKLAQNAQETVKQYSLDKVANQYVTIFKNIINTP